MVAPGLLFTRAQLASLCRRHHIRRLSLFGSVLRSDFRPDSDVDVLITFDPQHIPDFFRLHTIEQELSEIFGGRRVDLVTEGALSPLLRPRVLESAQVQYAEG